MEVLSLTCLTSSIIELAAILRYEAAMCFSNTSRIGRRCVFTSRAGIDVILNAPPMILAAQCCMEVRIRSIVPWCSFSPSGVYHAEQQ